MADDGIVRQWSVESARAMLIQRAPAWVAALLVVLIAWQLAGMTWMLAAGPRSSPQAQPAWARTGPTAANAGFDLPRLLDAHLFGRAATLSPPVAEQLPDTTLNLRLRGLIYANDPAFSYAMIADGAGQERTYRVDQTLPGGATLVAVYPDRVVISRAGALETLRLPRQTLSGVQGNSPPATPAPTNPTANTTAPTVQQLLAAQGASLLDVVRIQPWLQGGQIRGYQLFPAGDETLFRRLGLQPGDLVTAIDGIALTDPESALATLAARGNARSLTLTLTRGGVAQTLLLDTAVLSAPGTGVAQ